MTAPGLPRLRFDSRVLPSKDRFDRWQSVIAGTYDVSPPVRDRAQAFWMDTTVWRFGTLLLSDNAFGPRAQLRSPRNIRSDQVDHYRLILQTRGMLQSDAEDRRHSIDAGGLFVTDLSRREAYAADEGSNIVLFVPREMLDEALPRALDLHGVRLQGGSASLLADHMRSLVRTAGAITPGEVPALAQATVHLIAASLAPCAQTLDHARPTIESTLLRQACRYVDFHLTEPGLSAGQLCAFFKISRATLYRLFAPLGGVSHYVKERRLLRIHALLSSSTQRQYMGRLAEDHGFKTATHFSRAFREQFGYSPNEVRQKSIGPAAAADGEVSAERAAFDRWMRGLRG